MILAVPHVDVDGAQSIRLAIRSATPPAGEVRFEDVQGPGPHTTQVQWRALVEGPPDLFVATVPLQRIPRDVRVGRVCIGPVSRAVDIRMRALPDELPGRDAQPLRVLLSSCFYRKNDNGELGKAVGWLRDKYPPHLKILCGDQVYLDMPVSENLPRDKGPLGRRLLAKYLENWNDGVADSPGGYGNFLGWGANLFVSDDHEFWNNYPYRTAIASNTWTKAGRALWGKLAKELFLALQTCRALDAGPPPALCFTVGQRRRVSFFALDGRFSRTRELAYSPHDKARVLQWIAGLDCPGLLVLSQPLFEDSHGLFGRRFVDASLQDFDDHNEIERALLSAPHDIVVLSGDIHGGRVAQTNGARARIFEVVASPAALVDGNHYHRDPANERFPATAGRRDPRSTVHGGDPVLCDHVAMLSIRASAQSVHIDVEHWGLGALPRPKLTTRIENLQ